MNIDEICSYRVDCCGCPKENNCAFLEKKAKNKAITTNKKNMTIKELCDKYDICESCPFFEACPFNNIRETLYLTDKNNESATNAIIKTAKILGEDKEKSIKLKDRTLTNKEWVDLLQRNFNVSRTVAKEMLHGLMTMKQYDNFTKQFIH
jgi:hypothetical protein